MFDCRGLFYGRPRPPAGREKARREALRMMDETFELVISSLEHHTWQGTLRTGGETLPFQSELELLALARLLPPEGLDVSGRMDREAGSAQR